MSSNDATGEFTDSTTADLRENLSSLFLESYKGQYCIESEDMQKEVGLRSISFGSRKPEQGVRRE